MSVNEHLIYIVEDDADDRELLMDTIQEMNCDVIARTFNDGDELFDYLERFESLCLPSLIILDYNLPRLNGEAILLMLKMDGRYKHIPVVVYTSFLIKEVADDLLRLGAVSCIQKPARIREYHILVEGFVEMATSYATW